MNFLPTSQPHAAMKPMWPGGEYFDTQGAEYLLAQSLEKERLSHYKGTLPPVPAIVTHVKGM